MFLARQLTFMHMRTLCTKRTAMHQAGLPRTTDSILSLRTRSPHATNTAPADASREAIRAAGTAMRHSISAVSNRGSFVKRLA
jgi:glycerol-3-phosphate O-acyltransferase